MVKIIKVIFFDKHIMFDKHMPSDVYRVHTVALTAITTESCLWLYVRLREEGSLVRNEETNVSLLAVLASFLQDGFRMAVSPT